MYIYLGIRWETLVGGVEMRKLFDDEQVYSVEDVASILRVSKNSVYLYIKLGRLKGFRLGRTYRFLGADLNEFVKRVNDNENGNEFKKDERGGMGW